MPGTASSYIFSLEPGDKVIIERPPTATSTLFFDSTNEMMWIGEVAPVYGTSSRPDHAHDQDTEDYQLQENFFYGARALNEVFYLDDFLKLEKRIPQLQVPPCPLDRPDPAADAAGVALPPRFVHQVIYNTYLQGPRLRPKILNTTWRSGPDEQAP